MVAVSGKNSWLVTRAFDGFVFLLYSGFVMWAYVLYFEAEQNWTEDAISKSFSTSAQGRPAFPAVTVCAPSSLSSKKWQEVASLLEANDERSLIFDLFANSTPLLKRLHDDLLAAAMVSYATGPFLQDDELVQAHTSAWDFVKTMLEIGDRDLLRELGRVGTFLYEPIVPYSKLSSLFNATSPLENVNTVEDTAFQTRLRRVKSSFARISEKKTVLRDAMVMRLEHIIKNRNQEYPAEAALGLGQAFSKALQDHDFVVKGNLQRCGDCFNFGEYFAFVNGSLEIHDSFKETSVHDTPFVAFHTLALFVTMLQRHPLAKGELVRYLTRLYTEHIINDHNTEDSNSNPSDLDPELRAAIAANFKAYVDYTSYNDIPLPILWDLLENVDHQMTTETGLFPSKIMDLIQECYDNHGGKSCKVLSDTVRHVSESEQHVEAINRIRRRACRKHRFSRVAIPLCSASTTLSSSSSLEDCGSMFKREELGSWTEECYTSSSDIAGVSSLTMLLDHNKDEITAGGKLPPFNLYIHSSESADRNRLSAIPVERGVHLQYSVSAVSQIMSPSFKLVDRRARGGCFLANEVPMVDNITSTSTEDECIESFALKAAVEKCGCIPWTLMEMIGNANDIQNDQQTLCTTGPRLGCFRGVARSSMVRQLGEEKCHRRCKNTVHYLHALSSQQTLSDRPDTLEYIRQGCQNCTISNVTDPSLSVKHLFESGFRHLSTYNNDFIKNRMSDMSLVTIAFANTSHGTVTRGAKMNMLDKVGYVGGILGIFIGFSFMSLVQVMDKHLVQPWIVRRNEQNLSGGFQSLLSWLDKGQLLFFIASGVKAAIAFALVADMGNAWRHTEIVNFAEITTKTIPPAITLCPVTKPKWDYLAASLKEDHPLSSLSQLQVLASQTRSIVDQIVRLAWTGAMLDLHHHHSHHSNPYPQYLHFIKVVDINDVTAEQRVKANQRQLANWVQYRLSSSYSSSNRNNANFTLWYAKDSEKALLECVIHQLDVMSGIKNSYDGIDFLVGLLLQNIDNESNYNIIKDVLAKPGKVMGFSAPLAKLWSVLLDDDNDNDDEFGAGEKQQARFSKRFGYEAISIDEQMRFFTFASAVMKKASPGFSISSCQFSVPHSKTTTKSCNSNDKDAVSVKPMTGHPIRPDCIRVKTSIEDDGVSGMRSVELKLAYSLMSKSRMLNNTGIGVHLYIHSPQDKWPDFRRLLPIAVLPGEHKFIKVGEQVHFDMSDDLGRHTIPRERGCITEADYSQDQKDGSGALSCSLDWQLSLAIRTCLCRPYFYNNNITNTNNENIKDDTVTCQFHGLQCIREVMSLLSKRDCYHPCNRLEFLAELQYTKSLAEQEQRGMMETHDELLPLTTSDLFFNETGLDGHLRSIGAKYASKLTIEIEPYMKTIKRKRKLSTIDKIGMAGGTIGLFLGASFLDIVFFATSMLEKMTRLLS